MATRKKPRIVVIGGGTGIFNVLRGLKKRPCEITAIVTMADDGGSTGKLRDEYGVLPPGDIRQALVALSSSSRIWRDLFAFRFKNGGLKDHSFGNLFLSALEQTTSDFLKAIEHAAEILKTKGRVVPVTLTNTRLVAELKSGEVIYGESAIGLTESISRVFLKPRAKANPAALKAIKEADAIVIGPGSLFTSILPNLAVAGVARAIRAARAKKIFVCNIMTEPNETNGFALADFLKVLAGVLGRKTLDVGLYNTAKPALARLMAYADKGSQMVAKGQLPKRAPKIIERPLITSRSYIRHDPAKIAKAILDQI